MADDKRTSQPGELSDALIAGLIGVASDLNQSAADISNGLRDLIRAAALTRMQRWALGAVLLLGTLGAVSASVDGVLILQGQHENHRNTQIIKDCTTPAGACYRRGQAQTGQAITILQKYILISAECARQPGNKAAFDACVEASAKAEGLVK